VSGECLHHLVVIWWVLRQQVGVDPRVSVGLITADRMIDDLGVVPEVAIVVSNKFMHELDKRTTCSPGKSIFILQFIKQLV